MSSRPLLTLMFADATRVQTRLARPSQSSTDRSPERAGWHVATAHAAVRARDQLRARAQVRMRLGACPLVRSSASSHRRPRGPGVLQQHSVVASGSRFTAWAS